MTVTILTIIFLMMRVYNNNNNTTTVLLKKKSKHKYVNDDNATFAADYNTLFKCPKKDLSRKPLLKHSTSVLVVKGCQEG